MLTEEQGEKLNQLQKNVDGKIERILTAAQKEQAEGMRPGFGPGGFGIPPPPGRLMTDFMQARLKLTDQQKQQIQALQKQIDDTLAQLLTDEQKERLRPMQQGFGSLLCLWVMCFSGRTSIFVL